MFKNGWILLCACMAVLLFSTCSKDPSVAPGHMALTFDDGPDSLYTIRILDILKEKNVKATFFVTGQHVKRYPHVLERMHREGHLIGNHTYTHLYFPGATDSVVYKEVQETQRLIDSLIGPSSLKLVRTPYGFIDAHQTALLNSLGYKVVKWDIDPQDYNPQRTPSADAIADRVLLLRKDNAMVLLHSADYQDQQSREKTVLALPRIIDELRSKYNFDFITAAQIR